MGEGSKVPVDLYAAVTQATQPLAVLTGG